MSSKQQLPRRLHHTAYVTRDMEGTRNFYEELIGLQLQATWCEKDVLLGVERTYCHCFFGIADGGALAFFQFLNPADQVQFGPDMPKTPFHHIALDCDAATQRGIKRRLEAAGFTGQGLFEIDHGYCVSLYVTDPNGLMLEFAVDAPAAATPAVIATRHQNARKELARWLAGDHSSNNTFR
jgi:glyoxylase I family protein